MYRYTFTSSVAFAAAFVLSLSLFLQPLANVYAQEPTDVEGDTVAQEPIVAETPVEQPDDQKETDHRAVIDDEVTDSDESTSSESARLEELSSASISPDEAVQSNATNTSVTLESDEAAEMIGQTNQSATTSQSGASTATSTDEISPTQTADTSMTPATSSTTTAATSTTAESVDDTENPALHSGSNSDGHTATEEDQTEPDTVNPSDTATTTSDTNASQDESLTQATSSVKQEGPTLEEVSVVYSDQALAFNRNECTQVADGSFYCQKVDAKPVASDDLFSAPDSTGDMEIYVVQDGTQIQLTNNELEDASPYFDTRTNTIVWHRLLNDRYQIMSYDIDSAQETQITNTRVNNMQPSRSGQYTVWQRWVTNNWEIILYDGETEVQLTDSLKHDIAPHIHGDMIIWNVRASDGTQSLMTYEISTQTFNQISDTDGVSVVNPRMLVMYEARYQNGDSVMKGFDLVTKEIIPIEHLPRELPTDLPEPDATGETRALPTNQQNEEELEISELEPTPDLDTGSQLDLSDQVSTTTVATSTVETNPTLDLRPKAPSVASTTDTIVQQAAIPDVLVPNFEISSSTDNATSTQDT